jgi:hypothetical protein
MAVFAVGACYFATLEEHGSRSHVTFRTGPVEPKAEAFRLIEAEAEPRGGALVIAEDWWTYWALAYLGHGTSLDVRQTASRQTAAPAGGTYWAGYAGGAMERWAAGAKGVEPRFVIDGAGGGAVLKVWWTAPRVDPVKGR